MESGGTDNGGSRAEASTSTSPSVISSSPQHVQNASEERARLERKIEKLRENIVKKNIAQEGDVEEYLRVATNLEHKHRDVPLSENPQMARIKHHFERRNRRHNQGTEELQKKLEELEARLADLDAGVVRSGSGGGGGGSSGGVLHGLRNAGASFREKTGRLLNGASPVSSSFKHGPTGKRASFGSADHLPSGDGERSGAASNRVGHSTFYGSPSEKMVDGKGNRLTLPLTGGGTPRTPVESSSDRGGRASTDWGAFYDAEFEHLQRQRLHSYSRKTHNADETPSDHDRHGDGEPDPAPGLQPRDPEHMLARIGEMHQQQLDLQHAYTTLKREAETELRNLESQQVQSRFRIQHLEQTLNESMELHQNEVRQLKAELNTITARIEYQYNDRFKKVEEAVEAAENRVYRMETSWHENTEKLLNAGHSVWNALMLSGANIVVELLKIILYVIAFTLDAVKPLAGTRERAGTAIVVFVLALVLWNQLELGSYFHFGGGSNDSQVTTPKPAMPSHEAGSG